MEPNTLTLNEFHVIYRKNILIIDTNPIIINISKFQGLVARQPYICKISVLLGYTCIWLLGTFINSLCDKKINIKIVKIAV